MKTRNGFVSNSSSSSFMCVVPKDQHDAILADMEDELADIIRKYAEEGKVGTQEVVAYGDMCNMGGVVAYSGSIGWSEEMVVDADKFEEAQEVYKRALNNAGVQTMSMSFDM